MMRHHPALCGWWEIEPYRAGDSYCLETSSTIAVWYLFVVATFVELLSKSHIKRPPTPAEAAAVGRDIERDSAPRILDLG